MTQKKDESENSEGGWIDANKKGKNKKQNPAAKEQVQAIPERGPKVVRSSTMHSSKPQMSRSGPKQQTNEKKDETKQPSNRPNRQHTESSRAQNETDRKKAVEEVLRLEDEQYHVDFKRLPKEYTRTQPYRNVQPSVVNKKMEKKIEAEPAPIIQHVPSMLTEVHPIVTNTTGQMSYAEASKKSLRTGIPVASQIVPSESVGWGEIAPVNADTQAVVPDNEVASSSSVSREPTPPLAGSSISPGVNVNVESSIQNGVKETSPATVETMHSSNQTKSDVPEKKMSLALENGGTKRVEQVPVEKGSFTAAEDQYVPSKRTEVAQPQAHAPMVDVRALSGYPGVQQQGAGVSQFPYMMQPGQMSQQWTAAAQNGQMLPYVFPQQMVHPQMYNPGSYFPQHFIGTQPTWHTGYSGIPSDVPPGYSKQQQQQYQAGFSRGGYQNFQNAPPHVRPVPPGYSHQYNASGQTQHSYGNPLPPHFSQQFPGGGESQPQPSHVVSSTGQTEVAQGTWAPPQEAQSAWPMAAWNQNRS